MIVLIFEPHFKRLELRNENSRVALDGFASYGHFEGKVQGWALKNCNNQLWLKREVTEDGKKGSG